MANGNIKGITIEINGQTDGLQNALKDVNKQSKSLQDELKAVERGLKFDPGNVELVRQKQELLTASIQSTSEKLDTLKTAQAQVQAQFDRGEIGAEQYRAFQRELSNTEAALRGYEGQLSSMGSQQDRFEQAQQKMQAYMNATGQSADDLSATLGTRLSSAIRDGTASTDQLEMALNRIGRQAGHSGEDLEQFHTTLRNAANNSNLDEVRRDLDQIGQSADEADTEVSGLSKALSSVANGAKTGVKVGAAAIAGIGVAAVGAVAGVGAFVEANKEMSSDLARLKTNAETAGFSLEVVEEGFAKVAAVSGEADSAVETMSNLMATNFSDNQLAEALTYINGAAIQFSDTLKTEGIADGLQETFASGAAIGQFGELLERSGVNLDTFNAGLTTAKKNGTETDYVLQQLSALGLASTYEAYLENNTAITDYNAAQVDSQKKLAEFSDVLRPFITMLMEMGNIILDVVLGNKDLSTAFGELTKIISDLATKFADAAKEAMPKFIQSIKDALPKVLEAGVEILSKIMEGISSMYPKFLSNGIDLVGKLASTLIDNLPKILDAGVKMVTSIISGIASNLPKLVATALSLVLKLASTIVTNLPKIIDAGVKILTAIITGLGNTISSLVKFVSSDLIPAIKDTVKNTDWLQLGKDIIDGLILGIKDMTSKAVEAISGVAGSIIGAAKKVLDINSPADTFANITEYVGMEGLSL